ncbi:major facilitator superfamily permease [Capnocytophaga sp. oral taxon 338 str. F0234]|jgi:Fucose permease|nr:major facilitator superfamily permease [Capnocytophaga sp. oral taxon 338 str. F0234]
MFLQRKKELNYLYFCNPKKYSLMDNTPRTHYHILILIAVAHFLNDLLQGVLPSIYPALQSKFALSMAQVGLITFCYQLSASILQPLVGTYTDKHPMPYSQVIGMSFSALGIGLLSYANSYHLILLSVIFVGIGSSIFHPESSRISFLASGGKRSFAQAIFQLGGNAGSAIAPLFVILIILSRKTVNGSLIEENHLENLIWFVLFPMLAITILFFVGRWRKKLLKQSQALNKREIPLPDLTHAQIRNSMIILMFLVFSKNFYTAGISNYLQFYTIHKFGFTNAQAQIYLSYYLGAAAAGTLIGGFFGDRIGRKFIIWFSILGTAPFALWLPYANAHTTATLVILIGFIISSAFASILVYAQELLPKKIGMISGVFYGFAFGMGGLASAILGKLIDMTSIEFVYKLCSYLPLMGLITYFLPNLRKVKMKNYER